MVYAKIVGLIVFVLFFTVIQFSFLKQKQKKEKWAYLIFTMISLGLAVLLVVKPDLPGPTQLVKKLYPMILVKK
ncbi:hypothetical protein ACQKP0_02980 [Heyndrickxia sp. NPDC080065]|uniref:hypothetical protein n=1 Tax=Heyndrickxia sp. NPDC080065 TaxID=3390568 RepID=UPI003D026847